MLSQHATKCSKNSTGQVSDHYQNGLHSQPDLFADDYISKIVSIPEINFDPSIRLAPRPKGMRKDYVCSARHEIAYMGVLMQQLEEFSGLQRFHYAKHSIVLSCILANLLDAGRHGAQLLYSRENGRTAVDPRNPNRIDNRMISRVFDFLDCKGLLHNHRKGVKGVEGITSWVTPSNVLIAQLHYEQVRICLAEGRQLIELRDEKGKCKPLPARKTDQLKAERMTAPVRVYNRLWLDHLATYENMQGKQAPLIPFAIRIFNHRLDLGGRFYGEFQTLRKHERSTILIDGHETVEPDYSCLHIALLYAMAGLQIDLSTDAYATEGFDRKTIKLCMLRLVNSENLTAFKSIITRSSSAEARKAARDYEKAYKAWVADQRIGFYRDPPEKPVTLRYFIDDLPQGLKGENVLNAILKRHSAIADQFGQPDIGLRLQHLDSEIMGAVLMRLSSEGVPVLPVHDSVRCREQDQAKVMQVMHEEYQRVTGFNIKVEC